MKDPQIPHFAIVDGIRWEFGSPHLKNHLTATGWISRYANCDGTLKGRLEAKEGEK